MTTDNVRSNASTAIAPILIAEDKATDATTPSMAAQEARELGAKEYHAKPHRLAGLVALLTQISTRWLQQ